jgi:hypothetical protein
MDKEGRNGYERIGKTQDLKFVDAINWERCVAAHNRNNFLVAYTFFYFFHVILHAALEVLHFAHAQTHCCVVPHTAYTVRSDK